MISRTDRTVHRSNAGARKHHHYAVFLGYYRSADCAAGKHLSDLRKRRQFEASLAVLASIPECRPTPPLPCPAIDCAVDVQ